MAQRVYALRADVEAAESRLAAMRRELDWYQAGLQIFGDASQDPDVEAPLPVPDQPADTQSERERLQAHAAKRHPDRDAREADQDAQSRDGDRRVARARLATRGINGEHHTRSMMAQMHRQGQIKRIDRGRYRLPPEPKTTEGPLAVYVFSVGGVGRMR